MPNKGSKRLSNGKFATKKQIAKEKLVAPILLFLSIIVGAVVSTTEYTAVHSFQNSLIAPQAYANFTGETITQEEYDCARYGCEEPADEYKDEISMYISEAVDEFLPNHRSESLMIMHCLAHRESGHGASNAHGDGGKAGGPFQFWEETWTRMRGRMITDGKATDMTDRYNLKESVRTTAYAISKGWAKEWGPILRDSKGSDFASCQTPSWY